MNGLLDINEEIKLLSIPKEKITKYVDARNLIMRLWKTRFKEEIMSLQDLLNLDNIGLINNKIEECLKL